MTNSGGSQRRAVVGAVVLVVLVTVLALLTARNKPWTRGGWGDATADAQDARDGDGDTFNEDEPDEDEGQGVRLDSVHTQAQETPSTTNGHGGKPIDWPLLLSAVRLPQSNASGPRAPKRNVLFVKTPKVGGTTVAQVLQRYAAFHGMGVAKVPGERVAVRTCTGLYPEKQANWDKMVAFNANHRLEVFASHACLLDFMLEPRYWAQRRKPLLLSLVRDPWSQFVSKFRFTKLCCETEHWEWCELTCAKAGTPLQVVPFANFLCPTDRRSDACNSQTLYMGVGMIDEIIAPYDLVLLLERLNEGLALLHVLFGFPLSVLVTLPTNTNTAPMAPIPPALEQNIRKRLAVDYRMYHAAQRKFNATVRALDAEQRSLFEQTTRFISAANTAVVRACSSQCGHHPSISAARKACDASCLAEFDERVFA